MESVLSFLTNRLAADLRIMVATDREASKMWRELKLAMFFNMRHALTKEQYLANSRTILVAVEVFKKRRCQDEEDKIYYEGRRDLIRLHGKDLDRWYSPRSLAIIRFCKEYQRMRSNRCWTRLARDETHRCSYCYVDMMTEEHDIFYTKRRSSSTYPRGVLDLHTTDIDIILNLQEVMTAPDKMCEWHDKDPLKVETTVRQEEIEAFNMNPACIM